jgi:protein-disulfide isomerase
MLRLFLFPLALGLLLAPAGFAQGAQNRNGLNKAWLETYARHLWALGPDFNVAVDDPKPSADLAGFREVTLHVSQGPVSQDAKLLVSDDGTRIIEGSVYDPGANPFKNNLAKLTTQGAASEGTPGATVVVIEFTDFECPYCKQQAKILRDNLLLNYPKQVHFYFKDFPLSIHEWAKSAAIDGRCVLRQSPAAFWEYHDWVYAHQDDFSKENFKDQVMGWAQGRKEIDSLQLGRCIDEKATEKEVDASIEEGRALGIDGTPTIFINGRHIPAGVVDWANLKRFIDAEIEYQAKAKDAGEDANRKAAAITARPPAPPIGKKK